MLTKALIMQGRKRDVIRLIPNPSTGEGTVCEFPHSDCFPLGDGIAATLSPDEYIEKLGEDKVCERILAGLDIEVKRQRRENLAHNRYSDRNDKWLTKIEDLYDSYEYEVVHALASLVTGEEESDDEEEYYPSYSFQKHPKTQEQWEGYYSFDEDGIPSEEIYIGDEKDN